MDLKRFYIGCMDYGTMWGIIFGDWVIQILRRRFSTREYWAVSIKIHRLRDYGQKNEAAS